MNTKNMIQAIQEKQILDITFDSEEKGRIKRRCIPFDIGPSRKYKDGLERFHFFDLNSPKSSHNLSILPENILSIELTQETFEPSDYITWKPNWFLKRDWGKYS